MPHRRELRVQVREQMLDEKIKGEGKGKEGKRDSDKILSFSPLPFCPFFYCPVNFGGRFSTNALTASLWSAVWKV